MAFDKPSCLGDRAWHSGGVLGIPKASEQVKYRLTSVQ